MKTSTFVIIWSYVVRPERQSEFEQAYGPNGEWAELFRKAEGYFRTELLHDTETPDRYTTLDYWHSEDDYNKFHNQFVSEYQALDARFEEWTVSETLIGRFRIVSD